MLSFCICELLIHCCQHILIHYSSCRKDFFDLSCALGYSSTALLRQPNNLLYLKRTDLLLLSFFSASTFSSACSQLCLPYTGFGAFFESSLNCFNLTAKQKNICIFFITFFFFFFPPSCSSCELNHFSEGATEHQSEWKEPAGTRSAEVKKRSEAGTEIWLEMKLWGVRLAVLQDVRRGDSNCCSCKEEPTLLPSFLGQVPTMHPAWAFL